MENVKKNLLVLVLFFCFLTVTNAFGAKLKFVQMSDTHFSTVRESNSYKLLARSKSLIEDAIQQTNDMQNIDFVIFTGDLIDQPTVESFDEVMPIVKTLNVPWYFALGNHDTTDAGELTKSKMLTLLIANNPNQNFNSLYYSFVPKKGFRVIVLDSVIDENSVSLGHIPPEQMTFVENILKKSKKDVVLIFMHHPLLEPFSSPTHKIDNANEFYALLEKYNMPIAVFSGHYHVTKIIKHGHIISVSTPAVITHPHAFRAVKVSNNRNDAVFEFYYYETGLKDLQSKTRYTVFPKDRFTGKPDDRNCTIVIDKKSK